MVLVKILRYGGEVARPERTEPYINTVIQATKKGANAPAGPHFGPHLACAMFRAYLGFGEGLEDTGDDWQNSHER